MHIKVLTNIIHNSRQQLDLYLPDNGFDSVFVFFHGGALDENGDSVFGKPIFDFISRNRQ